MLQEEPSSSQEELDNHKECPMDTRELGESLFLLSMSNNEYGLYGFFKSETKFNITFLVMFSNILLKIT